MSDNMALYSDYAGRFTIELTGDMNPSSGSIVWTKVYQSASNEVSYDYTIPSTFTSGSETLVTKGIRSSMYLASDSSSWQPSSAYLVDQQVTPIVYDGVGEFSCQLVSNNPTCVVYNPNSSPATFSPNWTSEPLTVTPQLRLGNIIISLSDSTHLSGTCMKQIGGGATQALSSGESFNNNILTVNANQFTADSTTLAYIFSFEYTDPVSGVLYTTTEKITFYLVKNGETGDSLMSMVLSNDSIVIPESSTGTLDFSTATTTVSIFEGSNDVTSEWSIDTDYPICNGCIGQFATGSSYTYNITGWNSYNTSDVASVDFRYVRSGYSPVVKTLTLAKVHTGTSPHYYELGYDSLTSKKTVTNSTAVFAPASINFTAKEISGDTTTAFSTGYIKIYKNGTSTVLAQGTTTGGNFTYTFASSLTDLTYIRAELYETSSSSVVLDFQTIVILSDGIDGSPGTSLVTWTGYSNESPVSGAVSSMTLAPTSNTISIGHAYNKSPTATQSTNPTDYEPWVEYVGQSATELYTWIKYADDDQGGGISDDPTDPETGEYKPYIGFAYNKDTAEESEDPDDYMWSLIKGTDGQPGPQGVQGNPTYTWIKYSNYYPPTSDSQIYDTPTTDTVSIGIATNKDTQVESTHFNDYIWSKFKGDQGVKGDSGTDGKTLYATGSYYGYVMRHKIATLNSDNDVDAAYTGLTVSVKFNHANTVAGASSSPLYMDLYKSDGSTLLCSAHIYTNGSNSAYWASDQTVLFTLQYNGAGTSYWYVCSSPVYASTVTVGNPAGGNVYLDDSSMAIRKDSTNLATFNSTTLVLGKSDDFHTEVSNAAFNIQYSNTVLASFNSDNISLASGAGQISTNVSYGGIDQNGIRMKAAHQNYPNWTSNCGCYGQEIMMDSTCKQSSPYLNNRSNIHLYSSTTSSSVGIRSQYQGYNSTYSYGYIYMESELSNNVVTSTINMTANKINLDGKLYAQVVHLSNYQTSTSTSGNARIATANGASGAWEKGDILITPSSSRTIKHDITTELSKELDPKKLYDIEVVQFKYNELPEDDIRCNKDIIGFIAEQVGEVYPIAFDECKNDPQYNMWNYQILIPAMLKLMQEQHTEIEELKSRIGKLESNLGDN